MPFSMNFTGRTVNPVFRLRDISTLAWIEMNGRSDKMYTLLIMDFIFASHKIFLESFLIKA
jgi:hypothetical protein